MNIYEKLSNIQNELKAPKGQFNKFGGYKFRSCEDILEAVKPICKKYRTVLILSDTITNRGERYYIEATATLYSLETDANGATPKVENTAYAREEESKKGMDGSQITGTASSYARKYALNGLFNIDDTKDADTNEYKEQQENKNTETGELVLVNEAEAKTVYAIMKQKGLDVEKQLQSNYGISNTKELTKKQYASILNTIKKLPNKE